MSGLSTKFERRAAQRHEMARRLARSWATLSLPASAFFLMLNARIHPAHGLSWPRRLRLALRMWRNTRSIWTGTSYKAHLAMATKLFEMPPEVEGVVVECGCYLGGSTANLSLACEAVGRKLIVYDSFEGLPTPEGNDLYATDGQAGYLRGDLGVVEGNVRRFGAIGQCEFRKGWFSETLPAHSEPVVLAFLDVDYQASLDDCVRNLWPHLTDRGYLFTDEYMFTDFCALFWSERYWEQNFGRKPPGLIGSGSGIGVGSYYLGPATEWNLAHDPASVAYTRKDFSSHWDYDRDAEPIADEARPPVGGPI